MLLLHALHVQLHYRQVGDFGYATVKNTKIYSVKINDDVNLWSKVYLYLGLKHRITHMQNNRNLIWRYFQPKMSIFWLSQNQQW